MQFQKFALMLAGATITAGISLQASAVTVASFADPGSVAFNFQDDGVNNNGIGYLTAGNNSISVLLPHLGLAFANASYTLTDLGGNALATTAQTDLGGVIRADFESGVLTLITDVADNSLQAGDVILRAVFDSATGVFGNVFAADDFMGNNVKYTGFAVQNYLASTESFSFSAANFQPNILPLLSPADMENWTATTAFNASANLTPVPLPGAALLMVSGLLGLGANARRKRDSQEM